MNTFALIFTSLVALEHLYIFYLETCSTRSKATSRAFGMNADTLRNEHIAILLKNQGVYNGLLALLLAVSLWHGDLLWTQLLLGHVILVAAFGSITSNPKIIVKQGELAIIALCCSLM